MLWSPQHMCYAPQSISQDLLFDLYISLDNYNRKCISLLTNIETNPKQLSLLRYQN